MARFGTPFGCGAGLGGFLANNIAPGSGRLFGWSISADKTAPRGPIPYPGAGAVSGRLSLFAIAGGGRTPAEELLEDYRSVDPVFSDYAY